MFLSIFIFFVEYAFSQTITLMDTFENSWIIYSKVSLYNNLFHWQETSCCTPPNLELINATQYSNFQNTLQIILDGYVIKNEQFKLKNLGYSSNITYHINNSTNIAIENVCEQAKSDANTIESGMIEFELGVYDSESNLSLYLTFQYWLVCQYVLYSEQQQIKINFDASTFFIILLGCLCVWIFTKMAKIRSLKIEINLKKYPFIKRLIAVQSFQLEDQVLYFQGFIVNWILYIIYIVASILFYVLVHYINSWYEVVLILCLILSLFCCWFIINELQCFFSVNLKLQAQIFLSIRVCDCISIFLSIVLVTLYIILNQAWYISDLITFCISGSLLRLFKVISLRGVTILYGAIIIFDCIYYFYLLTQLFSVNYQIVVLQYSNYPVLFQIPQIKYNLNKVCVWLSLMDLVVPGLSISYLYRFDKNRNSRVYFVIGMLGLFFGIILWSLGTLSATSSGIQLPQSIFVYPLIILFTCLWALRQGDFRIIWFGQFYDKYLMDNFTVDYNPESSKEVLETSGLKKEQIATLMEGLKLNSQL
ncbi:unnamed protein product [Paramecium sonneborni]|uniref:Transmembrane protein n=1 Tax=Paramecium sonneborni TaxID=65129 RepID=A0A8S1RDJ4_9CILI|nr:unnamed protein product [Paramecium sonneborni]